MVTGQLGGETNPQTTTSVAHHSDLAFYFIANARVHALPLAWLSRTLPPFVFFNALRQHVPVMQTFLVSGELEATYQFIVRAMSSSNHRSGAWCLAYRRAGNDLSGAPHGVDDAPTFSETS